MLTVSSSRPQLVWEPLTLESVTRYAGAAVELALRLRKDDPPAPVTFSDHFAALSREVLPSAGFLNVSDFSEHQLAYFGIARQVLEGFDAFAALKKQFGAFLSAVRSDSVPALMQSEIDASLMTRSPHTLNTLFRLIGFTGAIDSRLTIDSLPFSVTHDTSALDFAIFVWNGVGWAREMFKSFPRLICALMTSANYEDAETSRAMFTDMFTSSPHAVVVALNAIRVAAFFVLHDVKPRGLFHSAAMEYVRGRVDILPGHTFETGELLGLFEPVYCFDDDDVHGRVSRVLELLNDLSFDVLSLKDGSDAYMRWVQTLCSAEASSVEHTMVASFKLDDCVVDSAETYVRLLSRKFDGFLIQYDHVDSDCEDEEEEEEEEEEDVRRFSKRRRVVQSSHSPVSHSEAAMEHIDVHDVDAERTLSFVADAGNGPFDPALAVSDRPLDVMSIAVEGIPVKSEPQFTILQNAHGQTVGFNPLAPSPEDGVATATPDGAMDEEEAQPESHEAAQLETHDTTETPQPEAGGTPQLEDGVATATADGVMDEEEAQPEVREAEQQEAHDTPPAAQPETQGTTEVVQPETQTAGMIDEEEPNTVRSSAPSEDAAHTTSGINPSACTKPVTMQAALAALGRAELILGPAQAIYRGHP